MGFCKIVFAGGYSFSSVYFSLSLGLRLINVSKSLSNISDTVCPFENIHA